MIVEVVRGWRCLSIFTRTIVCLSTVLTVGLLSCAVPVEEKSASQVSAVGKAKPATATSKKTPSPKAGTPVTIKKADLEERPSNLKELSVQEDRGRTALRMKFFKPVHQYRHFALTQPRRIVLDIYGQTKEPAGVENYRVDSDWVDTVKLVAKEGVLHIVLTIGAATLPPYLVNQEEGTLKVVIGSVDPKAPAKKVHRLVHGGKAVGKSVAETKATTPKLASTASVPPVVPKAKKPYTGQRISLDFKDADIKNVFRLLAEVSGLNIVVTDDVARKITVRLVDIPWDQALALLIATNGLDKEQVGNVIRISTASRLKAEKDALVAAKKANENLEPLKSAFLNINYAKVKDLVDQIKPGLSPRGVISADERSNTIIVRDIQKGIDEAKAVVSKLDARTPQVLIESNLIETTPTFSRALGVELQFTRGGTTLDSNAAAGSPFSATLGGTISIIQDKLGGLTDLATILSAAEQEGKIRIISRPSVVTLNNVESTIQSLRVLRVALPTGTTNVASGTGAAAGSAVATEQIPVGITLTVTPQISSDGFVMMNISVKSSTLGAQSSGSVIPDELSREAISNVLVRDGETIVIGGIMKDTSQENEAGIPYLKDIPLLGWFFKRHTLQKDFEELMVFITPRIMIGGAENLPSAEDIWREQMKKTQGG
ncbi:MAG: secretin N-terminal domain-containing protein [Candidatus Binatia bacterium]